MKISKKKKKSKKNPLFLLRGLPNRGAPKNRVLVTF